MCTVAVTCLGSGVATPTRAEELRVLAIELLIGIQQSEVRGLHLEGSTLEEARRLMSGVGSV